jgi:hypothetical protein
MRDKSSNGPRPKAESKEADLVTGLKTGHFRSDHVGCGIVPWK